MTDLAGNRLNHLLGSRDFIIRVQPGHPLKGGMPPFTQSMHLKPVGCYLFYLLQSIFAKKSKPVTS